MISQKLRNPYHQTTTISVVVPVRTLPLECKVRAPVFGSTLALVTGQDITAGRKCPSLSRVRLFATPWTVARQAPLSMEFSSQEYCLEFLPTQGYWSRLPFPPPGDLPDPGIKPLSHALQADSLPSELPGKANLASNLWVDLHLCLHSAAKMTYPLGCISSRPTAAQAKKTLSLLTARVMTFTGIFPTIGLMSSVPSTTRARGTWYCEPGTTGPLIYGKRLFPVEVLVGGQSLYICIKMMSWGHGGLVLYSWNWQTSELI